MSGYRRPLWMEYVDAVIIIAALVFLVVIVIIVFDSVVPAPACPPGFNSADLQTGTVCVIAPTQAPGGY